MSIATDKARIEGAKAGLASWLTSNGVSVPTGTKIDGLVGLLGDVPSGGGTIGGYNFVTGEFTLAENVTDLYELDVTDVYPALGITRGSDGSVPDNAVVIAVFLADPVPLRFSGIAGGMSVFKKTTMGGFDKLLSVGFTMRNGVPGVAAASYGFGLNDDAEDYFQYYDNLIIKASSTYPLVSANTYKWLIFGGIKG